jgi:hypothetical protein
MDIWGAVGFLGLIAAGFGVGSFGTLIGAGGGFVLMPMLLLLYPGRTAEQLTSLSLAVVFFNALSGTWAYGWMKRIDYEYGLIFAVATIPGAVLGALNTTYFSRRVFDAVFGVLLLVIATFLMLRPRPAGTGRKSESHFHGGAVRRLIDARGVEFTWSFNPITGIGLSVIVGYLSSLLGIGGGIIHVPALVYILNFPVHIATATSHFILAIMALTGTVVHMMNGAFTHGARQTVALGIGVIMGAQVGARLSERIQAVWIMRSLGAALGLLGLRIIMTVG